MTSTWARTTLRAWRTPALFFAISVGYTIAWTTVSSELAYYRHLYGPEILLQLNVAYFLPSLPVLLVQTWFDPYFDRRFGLATATAWRLVLGLGSSAAICASFPLQPQRQGDLLISVALLGVFSAVAFGSSYQLVSRFAAADTVALTTGFVGSGPLVLLTEALLDIGPTPSMHQRLWLFAMVATVVLAGLFASLALLWRPWRELNESTRPQSHQQGLRHSFGRFDSMWGHGWPTSAHLHGTVATQGAARDALEASLLDNGASVEAEPDGMHISSETTPLLASSDCAEVSTAELLQRLWPPAIALFSSAGTSVLVFPFFTFVPTCGRMGSMLPQMLFAAKTLADIVGRLLPQLAFFTTTHGIVLAATLRLAATPIFFLYINGSLHFVNDVFAISYVTIYWVTSGYVNTCAYLMAPRRVPHAAGARAGAIMALVFQVACLLALLLAFVIQAYSHLHVSGAASI